MRDIAEEARNELLEAEAKVYERDGQGQGCCNGQYNRNFHHHLWGITLRGLKLKGISFETAITEQYRCRKGNVEDALIEIYLASGSVQHVEDRIL